MSDRVRTCYDCIFFGYITTEVHSSFDGDIDDSYDVYGCTLPDDFCNPIKKHEENTKHPLSQDSADILAKKNGVGFSR